MSILRDEDAEVAHPGSQNLHVLPARQSLHLISSLNILLKTDNAPDGPTASADLPKLYKVLCNKIRFACMVVDTQEENAKVAHNANAHPFVCTVTCP